MILKTICNNVNIGNIDELYNYINDRKYDYIYMDRIMYDTSEVNHTINKISSILDKAGTLIINTKIKTINGETYNREEVKELISNMGYSDIRVITGEGEIEYYFIKS